MNSWWATGWTTGNCIATCPSLGYSNLKWFQPPGRFPIDRVEKSKSWKVGEREPCSPTLQLSNSPTLQLSNPPTLQLSNCSLAFPDGALLRKFQPEDKPNEALTVFVRDRRKLAAHQPARPPQDLSHILGLAARPHWRAPVGNIHEDVKLFSFGKRRDLVEHQADAPAADVFGHAAEALPLRGEVGVETGVFANEISALGPRDLPVQVQRQHDLRLARDFRDRPVLFVNTILAHKRDAHRAARFRHVRSTHRGGHPHRAVVDCLDLTGIRFTGGQQLQDNTFAHFGPMHGSLPEASPDGRTPPIRAPKIRVRTRRRCRSGG